MTTIALKKYLLSKINLLEDVAVLNQLKKVVQKNETIYQLSDYQIAKVAKSRKQFENGAFLSQEQMDEKVAEWLKE